METAKRERIRYDDVPLVFLSVFEHNSNLLPWREVGCEVQIIPATEDCDFDYELLEQKLRQHRSDKRIIIGAFSAGSNITGNLYDVDRISVACHKNNALAVFDYAAVGPYQEINFNGINESRVFTHKIPNEDLPYCYKDALFISPHKFVGGPGTSGILLAKKKLLRDRKPERVGGGPVFYVNELEHEFEANIEDLEESGTPGILQDIRAALAFQLKDQISFRTIHEMDERIHKRVIEGLLKIPNVMVLGNNRLPKVPIYSFIIRSRTGKLLHFNFVTSLLNDLFGIQVRGGCSCAAIYGQKILGIDLHKSREYK